MPLGDVSYVNDALDAVVASWPSSGATYRLYASDPQLATVLSDAELTSDGGYAPVTFAPGDWASSSGGSKSTTAPVDFGTATDAWSDVATYWGIVDGSGLLVFSDDITDSDVIEVDQAGDTATFTPTLTFAAGA